VKEIAMSLHHEPWIITDAKLPCLVLSGRAEPPSGLNKLKDALNSRIPDVANVYNCQAFSLDERCTWIFCFKSDGRVAFINLEPAPTTRGTNVMQDYMRAFLDARTRITDLIRSEGVDCDLVMEKISIEMTGRNFN
jgi:hypothetical protein